MQSLTSKHEHLTLYIHYDLLFVWSHVTHTLYGFRGFEAALFLFVQESRTNESIYDYVLNAGATLDEKMVQLLDMMRALLDV